MWLGPHAVQTSNMNDLKQTESSPTTSLARLATRLDWESTPSDVQRRVLLAVRDTLACGVAGYDTPLASMHRQANPINGGGNSQIVGSLISTSAQSAAFHNATAMNAMDFDDTAAVSGHPGAPILGAALAVAQECGASGSELLAAVLTGYEVSARVAVACRPSQLQYLLVHGSQSVLGFGTVAAVGKLLKLDEEGFLNAFGIVAALCPIPVAGKFGWDERQLSWIKDNVNWPAEAGVRAGKLAAHGFPASRTIFDGPRGFWRMVASDQFNPAALLDHNTFYTRSLAFKPYPCCRWMHSAVQACEQAFEHAGRPGQDRIGRITVTTTAAVSSNFGNPSPITMIDAQFSVPHAIAALCMSTPLERWWQKATREEPSALALMRKVSVLEDPEMSDAFIRNGRNVNTIPARVSIELLDGSRYEALCEAPLGVMAEGDDDTTLLMLARKHHALLATKYTDGAIARLLESIDGLPDSTSLDKLSHCLAALH